MKVIVAGSRELRSAMIVHEAIVASGFEITELVSGHCRGVDRMAEIWARARGIPVRTFPVPDEDWRIVGASAGPIRNRRMASYVGDGGGLVAIPIGGSRGTSDMIRVARDCGLAVYVHPTT